jgi:hypothetical protein
LGGELVAAGAVQSELADELLQSRSPLGLLRYLVHDLLFGNHSPQVIPLTHSL